MQQRLIQRRALALVEVVEEVDLVVFGGSKDGVAMRMVATFSEAPKSRMPRKVARMAKSEGIIARSRALGLRKTKRKTTKISAAVRAKLCASVGRGWRRPSLAGATRPPPASPRHRAAASASFSHAPAIFPVRAA